MKRLTKRRIFFLLILALCAPILPRVAQSSPVFGDEPTPPLVPQKIEAPQSIDEVLNDPLFNVDENASNKDVANAANELYRKFGFFIGSSQSKTFRNAGNINPTESKKRIEESQREMKKAADAFYAKYDAVFTARLLKIFADESFVNTNGNLANQALYGCLQTLRFQKNREGIAKIHECALESYQKTKDSDDQPAKEGALRRLVAADQFYLNPQAEFINEFEILSQAKPSPEELRAQYVKLGDKLAEEIKRDPFLIANCCQVYRVMLKSVDETLALQYRAKFREAIGKDAALEAFSKVHGHDVRLEDVAIWRDESFDESIFDVPENAEQSVYYRLQQDVKARINAADNAPIPQAAIDAYKNKGSAALAKIAIRLGELSLTDPNQSAGDYSALRELTLTKESALILKQTIDEETAKPFDEANARFLTVARAAILNFELEEAVKSKDKAAVLKVAERFVDRADFNSEAARKLVETIRSLAISKNEFASELLDLALAKAEKSNGDLSTYLRRLIEIKNPPKIPPQASAPIM